MFKCIKKITDIYNVDTEALVHSFQDACSNKEFREYLISLNIHEGLANLV